MRRAIAVLFVLLAAASPVRAQRLAGRVFAASRATAAPLTFRLPGTVTFLPPPQTQNVLFDTVAIGPLGSGHPAALFQITHGLVSGQGVLRIYATPEAAALDSFGGFMMVDNWTSVSNADFPSTGFQGLFSLAPTITPSAAIGGGGFAVALTNLSGTVNLPYSWTGALNELNAEININSGTAGVTGGSPGSGIVALNAEWDYGTTGNSDYVDAVVTSVGSNAAGVIAHGTSAHILTPYAEVGVVTDYAGLQIDDQSWTGSTTCYGIRYASPNGVSGYKCDGTAYIQGTQVKPNLTGTSGSIGGGSLLAGACTSGTVSITGAASGMAVVATPSTYPGDGSEWSAYVSASNTVTVKVCALVAVTPTASTYNVRVIQ